MRRAERIAALAVGLAALAAGHRGAAAQHHHHHHAAGDDAAVAPPSVTAMAMLSLEVGTVEAFAGDRDYQSASVMASARHRQAELMVHLPYYRLELGSTWETGVGDAHIEGRWHALSAPGVLGGDLAGGVSFAVMPPLGDDDLGLAMGHWMLMAGTFASYSSGRFSASGSLGWGGALGGGGHAEHGGGVWPPVSPMNAQEIELSIAPQLALGYGIGVSAGLSGAAPIGDGKVIGLVRAGATIALGRFEVGLGAGHGVAGHPGGLRVGTHVMAMF
jgi:hypothetical protein